MKRFTFVLTAAFLAGVIGCADSPAPTETELTSPTAPTAESNSAADETTHTETVAKGSEQTSDTQEPTDAESSSDSNSDEGGTHDPAKISLAAKSVDELDKFVAQQDGKVVVVDLWATW